MWEGAEVGEGGGDPSSSGGPAPLGTRRSLPVRGGGRGIRGGTGGSREARPGAGWRRRRNPAWPGGREAEAGCAAAPTPQPPFSRPGGDERPPGRSSAPPVAGAPGPRTAAWQGRVAFRAGGRGRGRRRRPGLRVRGPVPSRPGRGFPTFLGVARNVPGAPPSCFDVLILSENLTGSQSPWSGFSRPAGFRRAGFGCNPPVRRGAERSGAERSEVEGRPRRACPAAPAGPGWAGPPRLGEGYHCGGPDRHGLGEGQRWFKDNGPEVPAFRQADTDCQTESF